MHLLAKSVPHSHINGLSLITALFLSAHCVEEPYVEPLSVLLLEVHLGAELAVVSLPLNLYRFCIRCVPWIRNGSVRIKTGLEVLHRRFKHLELEEPLKLPCRTHIICDL